MGICIWLPSLIFCNGTQWIGEYDKRRTRAGQRIERVERRRAGERIERTRAGEGQERAGRGPRGDERGENPENLIYMLAIVAFYDVKPNNPNKPNNPVILTKTNSNNLS